MNALTELSSQIDYERARRKAFWRRVGSWLTGHSNDLLAFDEVRQQLRAHVQHERGLCQVPLASIVGSVGRYRDFDRVFLPRQTQTRQRWLSVSRAHYDDVILPPVELYQLGESYFVKDGNHRVSVARQRGQEFIDAYVVEVHAPIPVAALADLEEWIRRQDAIEFLATTRLTQLRPEARVELSLPGQYEKLLEHISVHRWYLGVEGRREVSYEEAVTSWYDRVYLPVVDIIRTSDALQEFPNRTEADLYLWIVERQWYLTQAGVLGAGYTLAELVRDYAEEYSERPITRLKLAVRRTVRCLVDELVR